MYFNRIKSYLKIIKTQRRIKTRGVREERGANVMCVCVCLSNENKRVRGRDPDIRIYSYLIGTEI